MKKLMAFAMSLVMVFTMAACGSGGSSTTTAPAAAGTTAADGTAGDSGSTKAAGGTTTAAGAAGTLTEEDPEVTIMLSHSSGEDTVVHLASMKFKELLEQYSGGKMTVDIYPNATLLSVAEMNEALKDNSVQMTVGSPGSGMATGLGIFELPNLVNSEEAAHKLLAKGSDFYNLVQGVFEDNSMHMLFMEPCSFRVLTSSKEVKSYEDLNGLDIRTMDSEVPLSFWKQWGANPTPLAWGEVYTSLQQGLVEAQENPYDSIIAANLNEVQKYLVSTNHIMFYTGIYVNKDWYYGLTENERALVDQVGDEVAAYSYEEAQATNAQKLKALQDKGMTYIEFSDADHDKMRENSTEAQEIVKKAIGEDLFQQMMTAMGY